MQIIKDEFNRKQFALRREIESNTEIKKEDSGRIKKVLPDCPDFLDITYCSFCGKAVMPLNSIIDESIEFYSNSEYYFHGVQFCCDSFKKIIVAGLKELKELSLEYDKRKRIMDNLDKAGIGKRFAEKNFSTFISSPENESFFRRGVDYALRFNEFSKEGKG